MTSDGFAWRSASPESQRMDGAKLAVLGSSLAARRTKAFLVVRHDRIVYEWYASGYGPSSRHYTASLAKALVGGMSLLLALSDGCIGIDDLACKYIPAWRGDPLKSQITIRHLVTHSSGIEDAELSAAERAKLLAEGRTLTDHHMSLPGWKGAFWRREPDPFSVAIHQAPVVYPPGTRYAYSNPGMAALAYAVTGSLQDTVYPDIRTLLQQRIMDPIGLPEDEWSIGYGRAYKVDGMDLYANWGGGEYTTRAIARVGRLMLRRGSWDGRQLIDPVWASRALGYAGTPRPVRSDRDLQPLSGIGWWTNSDGVWSCLSRDAFAGAGAGHQLLLVVPCRDVIVVRSGELLEAPTQREGFWGALDRRLLVPLMDTFLPRQERDARLAPYPPSSVIRDMAFEPPSAVVRKAFDSDNWPVTWGDDDYLYAAYGDGRGFAPFTETKLGLGFAKIAGPATDPIGTNVRSPSGENTGYGPEGAKASGLLAVDGVLYMWVRNVANSQLAWSTDHGRTWSWSNWKFTTSFGCPTFLNFGQNYAGARDDCVYVYSHDAGSAYKAADRMVMARVHRAWIAERGAYEFLEGLDAEGRPIWTDDIQRRGAAFTHRGCCRRSGISYNAPLGRYLWWQQVAEEDVDTRFSGGFAVYDAPEPWGPWTTAYYTREWDTGPGETGCFPTKWVSVGGTICYLLFSGNDCFSVRKAVLTVSGASMGGR